MKLFFSQIKVKSFLTVAFIFMSFAISYSQDTGAKREINEAIYNTLTGKYELATPVLKKYSDSLNLDDLTLLETNIYLSFCYFVTKKGTIDVNRLNRLTDSYLEKHGISKTDSLKRKSELSSLFYLSVFNNSVENYKEMVYYVLIAKNNFTEGWESGKDELRTETFKLLTRGYYYLEDFNSAIENGLIAYKLNVDFWGEKNPGLLEILDLLYLSYNGINESEKAIEFLQKEVEIGKEILGEKHPDYLFSLQNLAIQYSDLGNYQKAFEIIQKAIEPTKEVLGENHPAYLSGLNNLAYYYSKLGNYQKALETSLKANKLGKEVLGEKNSDYLIILEHLANNYSNLGNYQSALEEGLKLVELSKEVFGEKHLNYLISLNHLSSFYSYLGEYHIALEINKNVNEKFIEYFGENHPKYISVLGNLASNYRELGDYLIALEIDQKALQLSKEFLGEKHPDYFTILGNLAFTYLEIGDYQSAIEINKKVVELSENVLGEKHPLYLIYLNNLALNLSYLGEYRQSLEINQKVLDLRKKVLGEDHPDYLRSLNNIASNFSNIGDYQKALKGVLEVVELRKKVLGESHPDYLSSLNTLAYSYSDMGDYESALKINLQVLEFRKNVLGENHPDYLTSLNNLGSTYSKLGDYPSALEINQKVVDSARVILGEKNPNFLRILGNLASTFSEIGNYQKSLEINQQVVNAEKEILGEKHPNYLMSLNNLGFSYYRLGDFDSAYRVFQEVVKLSEEILGSRHPNHILKIVNLSFTELELEQFDLALNHIIQSLNLRRDRVWNYFGQITEHQRENFWAQSSYSFELFPMFLEKSAKPSPEEFNFAYDIALFTKGLLLNTTLDFDQLLAENGTSEAIEKYKDLKLLKLQIQRLYEKPIAERYLNVDSLETVAQELETELVNLSKEYGDYTQNLKITWKDVQSNLSDNEVAIEFLEYPTLTDTVKCAALLLRKDWTNPKFVSLFRKDQIEEFLKRDPNQIYSNGFVGKEIKKLVWDPLEKFIAPGDKVHFSAAGILHQLAIENLSSSDSTTLGDRYQMYRLSSTKELALQKPESKTQSVALYGGIKYDLELNQMITESEKYTEKDNLYALRGIAQDSTLRKGWQFLPGTLTEAHEIIEILNENQYQVGEFLGETGSEESFKALSGKENGIIHIATHGFFLPVEQSKRNPFIQMRFDGQSENMGYVDPMLRSGLLLAGGNRAWQGDSIPDTIEDGILTAKEISHVDLRETDLVVLSACETGLGDVSSEGVFGLQRAFKQAGAQTIIMSLWNVKDEATQYLMTNFYSYLMQGASKREAFIQARNRCQEQYQDPASWAAFIMLD